MPATYLEPHRDDFPPNSAPPHSGAVGPNAPSLRTWLDDLVSGQVDAERLQETWEGFPSVGLADELVAAVADAFLPARGAAAAAAPTTDVRGRAAEDFEADNRSLGSAESRAAGAWSRLWEQAHHGDVDAFFQFAYRGSREDPVEGGAIALRLRAFFAAAAAAALCLARQGEAVAPQVRRCALLFRAGLPSGADPPRAGADPFAAAAAPVLPSLPDDLPTPDTTFRQIERIVTSWLYTHAEEPNASAAAASAAAAAMTLDTITTFISQIRARRTAAVAGGGAAAAPTTVLDERTVRILYYGSDVPGEPARGQMARLVVEIVPLAIRPARVAVATDARGRAAGPRVAEASAFYPNPLQLGLAPFSRRFLQAAARAWAAACRIAPASEMDAARLPSEGGGGWGVRWHIEVEEATLSGAPVLMGRSLGAALAVGVAQLRRGELIDPDFAITGALPDGSGDGSADGSADGLDDGAGDGDTSLVPVAFVREKVFAALSRRREENNWTVARVAVPAGNEAEARQGAARAGRDEAGSVVSCATLRQCLQAASQQQHRLCQLEIRRLLADAGARLRRSFTDWRELERLYVPPCLRVMRRRSAAVEVSDDALARREEATALWPWGVLSGGLERERTTVVGEPGAGKSLLLLLETARRCADCSARVEADTDTDDRAAGYAVFVRAGQILPFLPRATGAGAALPRESVALAKARPDRFLSALVGLLSERHALTTEAERAWMARQIVRGHCLLCVDALDEVEESAMGTILAALSDQCQATPDVRCLLSVRPTQVGAMWDAHADWEQTRLRLCEFAPAQIREALTAYFSRSTNEEAGRIAHLLQAIEQRADLRRILQNPLHLHIICRYLEQDTQNRHKGTLPRRRADLYALLLEDARRDWLRRPPYPTQAQSALFGTLAAETAFRLYDQVSGESSWPLGLVREVTLSVRGRYPDYAGRSLLTDLQSAGLVTVVETAADAHTGGGGGQGDPRAGGRRLLLRPRGTGIETAADSHAIAATSGVAADNGRVADAPTAATADMTTRLAFRHQTIAAYLTGLHLAFWANRDGWASVAQYLTPRLRLPMFQETLPFLAAYLKDPFFLLEMLSDERTDNRERHRLLLAAHCLPEIFPSEEARTRL